MGSIAGNSLDLIRTVFNRNNVLPLPSTYWDAAARGSFFMQTGSMGPTTGFNSQMADSVRLEEDLMNRYQDYEEMDQFPELGAAIDLFSDDATVQDVMTGKSIWFEAEDDSVDHSLNDMLEVNLKVENELWEITRSLCKYGNEFIEPVVLDQMGVVKLNHMPPPWMRRIEDINGILYGYMQDPSMQFTIDTRTFLERVNNKGASQLEIPDNMGQSWLQVYEPWEVVHMRLRSRARRDLYGYSVVEAARYAWKRLSMMEDAMLMYKVTRSPQRYAFYVDVGDVPPQQARGLLNKIKNDFKKSKFIDPSTGRPSFRYSPLCLSLDTKISLLNGQTKTLQELIVDHESGVKNWTYSIDRQTKQIVPGEISWAGVTRKDASLVRVMLDNGSHEIVTPDHKFLLRNGEYCEAKDLKPGTSLMPFYRGKNKAGYEYVINPGESMDGWDCVALTHRVVAANLLGEIDGMQVHHEDENKVNNDPSNLRILTNAEHQKTHGHFLKWNQSEQHSKNSIANNRKYNKSRFLLAYNKTDKHKKDNVIRSVNLKRMRQEQGEEFNKKLRLKFSDDLRLALVELIQRMPDAGIDSLCHYIQENEESLSKFQEGNTRKIDSVHRHLVLKAIRSFGFNDYREFKKHALHNHKVSAVEFLDYTQDTGCITVEKWHNFALESGCFVKNSAEDDFFIPVRKERKGTEIEVLAGPEGQSVEDVEYFLNKIFAALKIPKSYLGADETVGRANLSQLDVRLCRSVMRIQREIKNGFRQIGRIDLAAKNIDPDRTSFECHMVIPSGVFELAQIEVEKAKLDLGASYRDANFSEYWIYSKILGLSDEEILQIQKQRVREGEGNITAEDAGLIHNALPRMVDRAQNRYDPRADRYQQKILDEIESGNTRFGRKLKELKLLTQDIRGTVKSKRFNGRR